MYRTKQRTKYRKVFLWLNEGLPSVKGCFSFQIYCSYLSCNGMKIRQLFKAVWRIRVRSNPDAFRNTDQDQFISSGSVPDPDLLHPDP